MYGWLMRFSGVEGENWELGTNHSEVCRTTTLFTKPAIGDSIGLFVLFFGILIPKKSPFGFVPANGPPV